MSNLIPTHLGWLRSRSLFVGSCSHLTHQSLNHPIHLSPINTSSYSMVEGREKNSRVMLLNLYPGLIHQRAIVEQVGAVRGQGASLVIECISTKSHGFKLLNLFSNAKLISFPHIFCIDLAYMLLDSLVTSMNVYVIFW